MSYANEKRIEHLKKFKDSYILLICFIFAVQLVITKIKTLYGSIGAIILLAGILMIPIFVVNMFIKIEESKLRKANQINLKGKKNNLQKRDGELFCSECRAIISKDSKFCSECGSKQ